MLNVGFGFMGIGMAVVFVFLTLLVLILKIVGGILKAFPDEEPVAPLAATGPGGGDQEIAIALAAVSSYKESR